MLFKKKSLTKKSKSFHSSYFFFFSVFQKLQACQWKGVIRWQVAEEVFFQGQTASHSQWLWTPSCIWLSLVRAGLLDISQASVFPTADRPTICFGDEILLFTKPHGKLTISHATNICTSNTGIFLAPKKTKEPSPNLQPQRNIQAFCWVPKKQQWLVQSNLKISLGGGASVQSLSHVQLFATPWWGVIIS